MQIYSATTTNKSTHIASGCIALAPLEAPLTRASDSNLPWSSAPPRSITTLTRSIQPKRASFSTKATLSWFKLPCNVRLKLSKNSSRLLKPTRPKCMSSLRPKNIRKRMKLLSHLSQKFSTTAALNQPL